MFTIWTAPTHLILDLLTQITNRRKVNLPGVARFYFYRISSCPMSHVKAHVECGELQIDVAV